MGNSSKQEEKNQLLLYILQCIQEKNHKELNNLKKEGFEINLMYKKENGNYIVTNSLTGCFETTLLFSIEHGSDETTIEFLENPIHIKISAPLLFAIKKLKYETIKLLLEKGVDVNVEYMEDNVFKSLKHILHLKSFTSLQNQKIVSEKNQEKKIEVNLNEENKLICKLEDLKLESQVGKKLQKNEEKKILKKEENDIKNKFDIQKKEILFLVIAITFYFLKRFY